jgi:hypothetical protein
MKDIDAITGLYGEFADLGDLEAHAIDTTDLDPAHTTAEIRSAVASGTYRLNA